MSYAMRAPWRVRCWRRLRALSWWLAAYAERDLPLAELGPQPLDTVTDGRIVRLNTNAARRSE